MTDMPLKSQEVKKYDLEERTANFAKRIRSFLKQLSRSPHSKDDFDQLKRSSGSVAANYIEANEALGKGDFVMRIRICLKESKESRLWLTLIELGTSDAAIMNEHQLLIDEASQFVRIFSSILRTATWKARSLDIGA